jgi:hypothetical protein
MCRVLDGRFIGRHDQIVSVRRALLRELIADPGRSARHHCKLI